MRSVCNPNPTPNVFSKVKSESDVHFFEHREMSLAERSIPTFSLPCRQRHGVYGYIYQELDPDTQDMYPHRWETKLVHGPCPPQESHSTISQRHQTHKSHRVNILTAPDIRDSSTIWSKAAWLTRQLKQNIDNFRIEMGGHGACRGCPLPSFVWKRKGWWF